MMRVAFVLMLVLSGCAYPPAVDERREHALSIAQEKGWHSALIPTQRFDLLSVHSRKDEQDQHLIIYIEGDGLAWETPTEISADPTPVNPIALKLALQHAEGNIAYLARPCQFSVNKRNCDPSVWTDARYGPEVIESIQQAIDHLTSYFQSRTISLVGYSGGGVIAALVAANRHDITQLVTVAANLNHQKWTEIHRLSPLKGSLNPPDYSASLSAVRQYHFVGGSDNVVPEQIVASYLEKFKPGQKPLLKVVPGFDHYCCWEQRWEALYIRSAIRQGKD